MAGPVGEDTGKGKGKGRPRGDDGSAVSPSQGERTPPPDEEGRLTTSSQSRSLPVRLLCRIDEMRAPRRKTVCLFAVVVSMLALLKGFLLPAGGEVPAHLEDDLIRLVLAEEAEGIANTIRKEARIFEDIRARRAGALKEIQGFEARLKATAIEMRALEGLGRAVHEDNSSDAGLTTEVTKVQGSLQDLHRSAMNELDGFKRQLEGQAKTMREVRDGIAKISLLSERSEDRIHAAVHGKLETRLEENLADLKGFYHIVKERVDGLSPDTIRAADLEALLERAAQSPMQTGTSGDDSGDPHGSAEEQLQALCKAAVDKEVERRMAWWGNGGDGGGHGDGGCVSEEVLREEVAVAIGKLLADGTGLRDYANAAVGGQVLTSRGMVSDTYSPMSWFGASRYWHGAGVENGVGPVGSVISEDSSLGECWAMSGSEGLVTIQLPREITVDGVSLEHASRMVTMESTSAPKEFEVWGLRNKNDHLPVKLGSALYDIDGRPIQTFPITPLGVKFTVIQFKILSNWGNPDYTCVYRLRVHGRESN